MARLANAPVCYTIAQISFNEVTNIDSVLPILREAFHSMGFLDHHPIRTQGLEVHHDQSSFSFSQAETIRHAFRNKDKTAVVLLGPDTLAYETTEYSIFDKFSKTFLDAVSLVNEQRAIEYCDRLGMRMLDAIQPQPGEQLDAYVNAKALGLGGLLAGGLTHKHSLVESSFENDESTLNVRSFRGGQGIAIPPDLAPLRLDMQPRFAEYAGKTIMLDSDSFQSERCDFSIENIAKRMKALKKVLSASFKGITTEYARQVWE